MQPNKVAARLQDLRHWLGRGTEPLLLFPGLAVLLLGVLWIATASLVRLEYANARATATVTTRELSETYEAQIVRALREIDRTLKVVAYAYASHGAESVLADLGKSTLLLPDFLFTVSIADADGNIRASTRVGGRANIAGTDYFEAQRAQAVFAVGAPQPNPQSHDWGLTFSRRLDKADGGFAGVVVIAVDAAYFVSAYEPAKLGQHGFLGLLGTDGVFRAARSGDTVSAGAVVPFASIVPHTEDDLTGDVLTPVLLSVNPWDGQQRYTAARMLYEFPLAVIVGLSQEEQLHPAAVQARGCGEAFGNQADVVYRAADDVVQPGFEHATRPVFLVAPFSAGDPLFVVFAREDELQAAPPGIFVEHGYDQCAVEFGEVFVILFIRAVEHDAIITLKHARAVGAGEVLAGEVVVLVGAENLAAGQPYGVRPGGGAFGIGVRFGIGLALGFGQAFLVGIDHRQHDHPEARTQLSAIRARDRAGVQGCRPARGCVHQRFRDQRTDRDDDCRPARPGCLAHRFRGGWLSRWRGGRSPYEEVRA